MTSAERNEVRRVAQASLDAHANCRRPTDGPCTCGDCAGWRAILCYVPTGTTDAQHVVDLTVTAAGLRAQVESLRECLRGANEGRAAMATDMGVAMGDRDGNAAERDALAAQLAEVRADLDAAPKVCAIHSYEHGPGPCMTCGAWPPGTRELIAACQTRIAGLEQAADERSAEVARLTAQLEEARGALVDIADDLHVSTIGVTSTDVATRCGVAVARLTARVAELEARPVLTVERLTAAWCCAGAEIGMPNRSYVADLAGRAMRHLGLVTLLTAQDDPMRHHESRDYALQSPANGYWPADVGAVNGTEAMVMGAMLRSVGPHPISDAALIAMARTAIECVDKLGAPPTSPPAARPVFAGVSEDELIRLFYVVGTDGIDHGENCPPIDSSDRSGIRAVLARLEVSLVAPVDPEEVARDFYIRLSKLTGSLQLSAHTDGDRRDRIETMRATLIARGIPVTPERGQ